MTWASPSSNRRAIIGLVKFLSLSHLNLLPFYSHHARAIRSQQLELTGPACLCIPPYVYLFHAAASPVRKVVLTSN